MPLDNIGPRLISKYLEEEKRRPSHPAAEVDDNEAPRRGNSDA
jgi:hypothetical protein